MGANILTGARFLRNALASMPATALVAPCDEGLSTAEVRERVETRVTADLDLSPDASLFSNVFVGEPYDGDVVICGTVEGTRRDGSKIAARRFIATEGGLVQFALAPEESHKVDSSEHYLTWKSNCAAEEQVR